MPARRGFEESDSEDDIGSVTSSWTAQSEARSAYPVDYILAEKEDEPDRTFYLVKWTGYSLERSTWEPSANLGDTTIDVWLNKKKAIQRGFGKPFNLVNWEEKQALLRDTNNRRWKQRARKLAKQGRSADPPDDHPAAQADPPTVIENPCLSRSVSPPQSINPAAGRKPPAVQSHALITANHSTKKVPVNQVEKKEGAEIMAKFAEEPQPKHKKRLSIEETLFKYKSHMWNVEKAGRDGAAPKAEDIILAKPGEIKQTNFTTKPGTPMGPTQKTSSPAESRRPSAADGAPAPYAGNIPLTCFYWNAHMECPVGETQCYFVHAPVENEDARRFATRALHEQSLETGGARKPKFFDRTNVCYYWSASGHCHHGDTGCWFAHWWPNNGDWIMRMRNDKQGKSRVGKPESAGPGGPTRLARTCRYWLKGNCRDPGCKYMHEVLESPTDSARHSIPVSIQKASNTNRSPIPHQMPNSRGKISEICPFWGRGYCRKSDEDCKYLHNTSLNTKQIPKTRIPETCPYWARGYCHKSDEDCKYMHNNSPRVALPPHIVRPIDPFPPTYDHSYEAVPPSGYFDHLAQTSAERVNKRVTQASPEVSQRRSGSNEATSDSRPYPLVEMGTDSSDVMDTDSNSSFSPPATLDVFIRISDESTAVRARIIELESSASDVLRTDFSMTPNLVLSNICMREFLEGFVLPLAPIVLSVGKVIEAEGQSLIQLANILAEHRSAAIVQGPSSLLILYPSSLILSEGVFLERKSAILPNCHICVEVRAADSNFLAAMPSSSSLPRTLERLFHKNHGWKSEDFFAWSQNRDVSRNVYIMAHPTSHKSETEMLARYFRELQARVWIPGTKGSWYDFLKNDEGVIIFHPDFNSYEGVPKLSRKLLGKFNIFQLKVEMKDGSPSKLTAKKIMRRGTCTLLTDEMYTHLPCESLELLKFIAKMNEGKKTNSERTWGVYGRPHLSDFLLELVEFQHDKDDSVKKAARFPLYEEVELLEGNDSELPILSSEIQINPSRAPNFDEFRKIDAAQAAWKLLESFATESLKWTNDYRRVVVVYPPEGVVDPKVKRVYEEWEASPKAQHISFMVPEKFMRTFNPA